MDRVVGSTPHPSMGQSVIAGGLLAIPAAYNKQHIITAGKQMLATRSDRQLVAILSILGSSIFLVKVFLATQLELYSDEIFYWQASQFPALAYSDLPFMSALFAGIGTELSGNSPIAVRLPFLLCGSLTPLLLYWIALPLTGQRAALETATLTLCLPMAAFMGLLAVPDVPMVFFGLLFIGAFERATRTGKTIWWFAAGLFTALGLSSHYRYVLYPFAALMYLLITRSQWHNWRHPALWVAALIGLTGLYPALTFNLNNDLSGIDYHLLDRHPWRFQAEGLLHPVIQSVIVTPLLYALCWYVVWHLLRKAKSGSHRHGMMLSFAISHLGVFMLLAPWSDTTRTTVHWPLSGYLPLLVFLPEAMRNLVSTLEEKWPARSIRTGITMAPVLGLTGVILLFAGIGSQGFNQQLQQVLGNDVLSNKMAGWRQLTEHLSSLEQNYPSPQQLLIITDNYYTSAQIAFAHPSADVMTIDEDKTIRDGRYTQYAIWRRNTSAVLQQAGRNAIFVTEDSTLNQLEKIGVMTRACEMFSRLTFLEQLSLYGGDKRFGFYYGESIGSAPDTASPCPLPGSAWLDSPQANETLTGTASVSGWAMAPGFGVSRVRLLLDRQVIAETERSISREDVVTLMGGYRDPDSPILGFSLNVDSTRYPNGWYELMLETESNNGQRELNVPRRIRIQNQ